MNSDDYYKQRALKRLAIIGAVLIVAGGAAWYLARTDSFREISALETSAERIAAEDVSQTFSAPAPLVATSTGRGVANTGTKGAGTGATSGAGTSATLTRAGIIADTNEQRAENGKLSPLAENATLDEIASLRLDDMFAKQYFAHISPSSSSAITVAQAVDYQYITLGENLALGNFDGDQGVVTAWMNSPGHRANILDKGYTEIGVAAKQGLFQGYKTWIAVQIFGRPASDCPSPDTNLKAQIDAAQIQITAWGAEIQTDQAQINAMQPQYGDAYNQATNNYNNLVDQYNNLVTETKAQVAQYNAGVAAYNQCIGATPP